MARRSNRRRDTNVHIANQRLPTYSPRTIDLSETLKILEDRRQWHPEGADRPARSFNTTRHRLVDASYVTQKKVPPRVRKKIGRFAPAFQNTLVTRLGFEDPTTLICVRRKRRKEVLHALNKTGQRGQRRPRFNRYSKIHCK